MKRDDLLAKLRKLNACKEAVAWLTDSKHATLLAAWKACERPDWMFWLLHQLGADRKLMVELACDCAETALPIYAKRYPNDDRPANAIKTARAWACGKATIEEVREARRQCWSAATDAAADAAWAANAATDAAWSANAAAAWAAAATDAAADAAWAANAAADAAWAAARKKANKSMAALIRKRVPNPEEL